MIWSETRNSNLFYNLSLKPKNTNLFGLKLEIQTSFIFEDLKREKQIYLVRNLKFKPFSYFKPKNEKSKFIWSETRNSNLFYMIGLKTRKAKKLEIQTSLIFSA